MKITCFGEVLWDIFPTHKKIGGAPLNVALRFNSMGVESSVITKTGNDTLGDDIKKYVKEHDLSINNFQIGAKYKTGEVLITLDQNKAATYQISKPVAWDFIAYTDSAKEEVENSDAIIFGSLACRNEVSRDTLFRLLDDAKFKILDINLRPPHYTEDLLLQLMKKADFIKLNDEELEEICAHLNIREAALEERIQEIADSVNSRQICITKGGKGATLFYNNRFYHNAGYKIKVIDTVGAGDSFLAALISELMQGKKPQDAIDYACAMGALVAGSKGANSSFTKEEVINFISAQN